MEKKCRVVTSYLQSLTVVAEVLNVTRSCSIRIASSVLANMHVAS